jgi:hypothetical protein
MFTSPLITATPMKAVLHRAKAAAISFFSCLTFTIVPLDCPRSGFAAIPTAARPVPSAAFIGVAVMSGLVNILYLTGSFFMLEVYDRVIPSRSVPTIENVHQPAHHGHADEGRLASRQSGGDFVLFVPNASRSVPTLIGLAALALVLYAFQGVLEALRGRILARVGAALDEALSGRVFDLVVRAPLKGTTQGLRGRRRRSAGETGSRSAGRPASRADRRRRKDRNRTGTASPPS